MKKNPIEPIEEETEKNKILKEIRPTIFTRRLTIIVLIILALVLQFLLNIFRRPAIFGILAFWFLTTYFLHGLLKNKQLGKK